LLHDNGYEQTTQWPKEIVQKDKQRSTKHTYKTKDRVTRTPYRYFHWKTLICFPFWVRKEIILADWKRGGVCIK
jgi:hypothetical protein